MKAESVAIPTPITAAVRMPATITGRASGTSTIQSRWRRVKPMPMAASMMSGEIPSSPVNVFLTMGRRA